MIIFWQTPGGSIIMDPIKITTEPEPQIPMAPMVPGQIPMASPQQPFGMPQLPQTPLPQASQSPQIPYSVTIAGLAAPQPQSQPQLPPPVLAPFYKPMPNDCKDYSKPRCQVFLDWPTGTHCQI